MSYTPQPLDTMPPGTVVAGPNSGAPGIPMARAIMPTDLPGHQHSWSDVYGLPDTLSGYGITDAAPKNNAALTGTPTAPTPGIGEPTNSVRIATVGFAHNMFTLYFQSGTVNIGNTGATNVINIGTGTNPKTINIGGPADEVHIGGNLTYIQATTMEVTDKQVVVNKGGAAASGAASGIGVEEGGVVTAFFQVSGARDGWEMKAPGRGGVVRVTMPASAFTAELSIPDISAKRIYTFPDKDITLAGLDSPDFIGNPMAPTPGLGDNSRRLSTTAFVVTALANSGFGPTSSVGLSMPNGIFTVTNSPVTTSGTLTVGLVQQAKNLIFASPTNATGAPGFRSLDASDFPDSGITAGTYRSLTIDSKGRATGGSNPTTLGGYGITDAAPKVDADLTGTPTADAPAANDNSRRIITSAWLRARIANTNPVMDGNAAPGSSGTLADAAHVHPSDTSRVKANGVPEFGGGPVASRPSAGVVGRIWVNTDNWTISRDNGTGWDVVMPAFGGDVNNTAGSTDIFLDDIVAPGTGTKLTYDAKGRITGSTASRSKSALRFYYENPLTLNDKQPALRIDGNGIITAVRYFRDNTVAPSQDGVIEIRRNGVLAYTVNLRGADAHQTWILVSNTDVAVADGDTITAVVTQAGVQVANLTLQCEVELDTK